MSNNEHFYKCQGDLVNLPLEFKCWKTLNNYRSEWLFLPPALRERVAEQCMACDYLMSMELWLQPISKIEQGQKIMLIQGLASVYEGVLGFLLDAKISKEKKDKFFATIIDERYDTNRRTFGPTLGACCAAEILDDAWSTYLHQIHEVRNWVHLSREKKGHMLRWINNRDCRDFRIKLDEFNQYVRSFI